MVKLVPLDFFHDFPGSSFFRTFLGFRISNILGPKPKLIKLRLIQRFL